MRRLIAVAVAIAFLVVAAGAKDKKAKQELPDYVLNAKSVIVVIDRDAGMNVANPGENKKAIDDVESALEKWGRFRVQSFANETAKPDLVISVRKGGAMKTVINGVPDPRQTGGINTTEDRTRIGNMGGPNVGVPQQRNPGLGTEYGSEEDSFDVYISDMQVPVWRYRGRKALDSPGNRAVEEFKKAFTRSEEAKAKNKS